MPVSFKSFFLFLGFTLIIQAFPLSAQMFDLRTDFSRQDTLHGAVTPERIWWDLIDYHLDVTVHIEDQRLSGSNTVFYRVLEPHHIMQIDLQEPMNITRVTQNGSELPFSREGLAWFIELPDDHTEGEIRSLRVEYSGKPVVAANPPWNGGLTWQSDGNGNPFVANANQGIGPSVWWPNKDHPYDEPDSMRISLTVPDSLVAVSNGRHTGTDQHENGTATWHWKVVNPINAYGVNLSVGDYVHFGEEYEGEDGTLTLDYYVLRENEEKARAQFEQVKPMMEAFEYWFGPYPFYEDGFKLIEVPYLGMEHQSAVTYGNDYENGYRGRDLSGSGWGLLFDFIIIHETGHEWFANNITYADVADMWVHEGFTNYSESLYLDYHHGEQAAGEYVRGLRLTIQNDRPLMGIRGVRFRGSSDMYNKGGNLLHTIRQIVNDDELWRQTLRGLNAKFRHETVYSEEIEEYISGKTGVDLQTVFDQYLRDIRIPTFEYAFRDGQLMYRWGNAINGFTMPVDVTIDGINLRLETTDSWSTMPWENWEDAQLEVDPDYYVGSFDLLGGQ
ncbi:M1 family metallopeptidase [Rhodohalobacter mucosus]|uniref:Peptidase M1 n=1 Tax=Rhodohalobacter mucosus TaxID=2079485 RepID=A0A316TQ46_9BACT|nr:M1 family metallopeptidase [Rhodohalobacter mucosus]PWN06727.1 peptidase M1 [Rhodohalobacter mucosus]